MAHAYFNASFEASHSCQVLVNTYCDHFGIFSDICLTVDFTFDYIYDIACCAGYGVLCVGYSHIVFEMLCVDRVCDY